MRTESSEALSPGLFNFISYFDILINRLVDAVCRCLEVAVEKKGPKAYFKDCLTWQLVNGNGYPWLNSSSEISDTTQNKLYRYHCKQ